MSHPFFSYHGPLSISEISKILKVKIDITKNSQIVDVKDLLNAEQNYLTFLHSNKYLDIAKSTKASNCVTTPKFKDNLPKHMVPLRMLFKKIELSHRFKKL